VQDRANSKMINKFEVIQQQQQHLQYVREFSSAPLNMMIEKRPVTVQKKIFNPSYERKIVYE
jgi:hypothetical protein